MDWDNFQQRVKAVVPDQELKPKRCWIGVLNHNKSPSDDTLLESDFVWMIGHLKITVQKIHETYQNRQNIEGFQIWYRDTSVNYSDVVKSFIEPDNDLVVFQASLSDPSPQNESDVQAEIASQVLETDSIPVDSVEPCESTNSEERSSAGSVAKQEQLQEQEQPQLSNKAVQSSLAAGHNEVVYPDHAGIKEERRTPLPVRSTPIFQTPTKDFAHTFDPDSVFHREPSPEMSQEEPVSTDRHIRDVIEQNDPEILEAGVAKSMKILEHLKRVFAQYASPDAQSWSQSIDKLTPQAERKRTVVGVVGNTGAGKSSVINAMLDEEGLVPTNCMRACTAVVTKISWNNSEDPFAKYRAEIEFISREDWEKELNIIMKEFLTENGTLSREASDPNSEAGIAWAKFHSVYPKIPKDSLTARSVSSLMSEKAVAEVLGTTKKINTAAPGRFYRELQKYVDSKEKVTKKNNKSKEEKPRLFALEHWPLIKVVKIYTKSPALSTGAVIVDLPGVSNPTLHMWTKVIGHFPRIIAQGGLRVEAVHDSNAARAAVAQGYMKQCTGLWIVAPINRAVDDKAAKTLLGDSFKRQLKYDGGFSSVTFICSKTDDISITEAIGSLQLEDEAKELYEQQRYYDEQIEDLETKILGLRESQDVYKIALTEVNKEIGVWEELQEKLEDGDQVFAPPTKANKRKRGGSAAKSRKKQQTLYDDSEDDEFLASDEEGSDDDDEVWIEPAQRSVSEAEIREKLKELKKSKKNARQSGLEIRTSIQDLKSQIRGHQLQLDDIKANIRRICIAGRNEYSKSAIQRDFAAGIKEIDQENAAEEDEDHFNPDEEVRDYDQVAESLPVFCVSSRAYQKMCGRLLKDDSVPGFLTPKETEIPQLQLHCKKLTEGGRIHTSRTFLLSLCQLLTTFNLWVSSDGTGLKMTDDDKRRQVKHLGRRLDELKTGLERAVCACIDEMRVELKTQIFDKCPELISDAIQAAPETANAWGYKNMGGLVWATYKAVVRRDGVYQSSSAGHRDFNADLVNPIVKKLATGWERAFQNRLPKAFHTYITNSSVILLRFHESIEQRAHEKGVAFANMSILKTQIHTYEQLFKDLGVSLIAQMTDLQREANRDFTPTIANIMHTVYDICTSEYGAGSYKRMKDHMKNHVERERHNMFHAATETVEQHLNQMCKALQESMKAKADEIFAKMSTDYMQVLGGLARDQLAMLPSRAEMALRSEIRDVLRGIDAQFEPIANGYLGSPEQDASNANATPIEDEDSGVFESARESADENANDDSIMEDNDDTMLTELTPQKGTDNEFDMNDNRRGPPTPFSNDSMNEGL